MEKVPDNYLFLGDSITDFYDLDKYYKDLPVVNSGISGNTIDDILKDMKKRDSGTILNVASSAAFFPGPLLSSYYASKSYVYKLSLAINEELNRCKSNVKISVLCPGPVATNFNNRAGVTFSFKPLTSYYVADYALKKCLKGKTVIIPSITMKLGKFFSHFVSDKFIAKITYNIQKKKEK